jgi:hypothetical protein
VSVDISSQRMLIAPWQAQLTGIRYLDGAARHAI